MARVKQFFVPVVAIIAGIVALIMGFQMYQNSKVYLPTTAVITDIQEEWTGSGGTEGSNYDYHVFIRYTVDGTQYDNELGEYDATMDIGDKLDIVYNPENPNQTQKAGATSYLILWGIGVLFIVAGLFFIVKTIRDPESLIDNSMRDDI